MHIERRRRQRPGDYDQATCKANRRRGHQLGQGPST
jgi:hypothetical protein